MNADAISRKVLFVDDEPMMLEGIRRQLRGRFAVTTAVGGEAGLAVLREQGPFAVVVSDYRMLGMDGVKFLRHVRELSPEVVRVMLTGQAELDVAVNALHEGCIFRFLSKPCSRETLTAVLDDCLEQHRLAVSEKLLRRELDAANQELRKLNQNLENLVARRTATIENLYLLVSELNGLDSLEEVVHSIVLRTADTLRSRRAALLLPDASGEYLCMRAAVGIDAVIRGQVRMPIGAPLAGRVYQKGECVVVNDAAGLSALAPACEPVELLSAPLALTPLLTPEGPVGVLGVAHPIEAQGYDSESLAALHAVAKAAGIALLNQVRRQERDDARDATILALAKLAEHRDPETGAHLERVQCYCRLLCEALAAEEKYASVVTRGFIENIVRSSPLHDIGKVGIPDYILLKPGKLTDEEFEIMKTHSRIGGDTIRALVEQGRRQSFLDMGMEIAYYHHEKWDGSGYPFGLTGEAIPLPARILALADVYDALTSRRVYKASVPHARAREIIIEGSGTHFDPDVVAAFKRQAGEFERLSMALAEPESGRPAVVRVAG